METHIDQLIVTVMINDIRRFTPFANYTQSIIFCGNLNCTQLTGRTFNWNSIIRFVLKNLQIFALIRLEQMTKNWAPFST